MKYVKRRKVLEKFVIVMPRGFLIFLALFVLFGGIISAESSALLLFSAFAFPLSMYISLKVHKIFYNSELDDVNDEEKEDHLGKVIPLFKKDDSFSRVFEYRVDKLGKDDFKE